jgi:hypothetical protein
MIKSAWDDSSEEEDALPTPAITTACELSDAALDLMPEDAVIPDAHPATPQARLFWGAAQGSMRCVARALQLGAPASCVLTNDIFEELETISSLAASSSSAKQTPQLRGRGAASYRAALAKPSLAVEAELGDSAMHVAARADQLECALLLLLQPGLSDWPTRRNRKGESAIDVARAGSAMREVLRSSTRALLALEWQREALGAPAEGNR